MAVEEGKESVLDAVNAALEGHVNAPDDSTLDTEIEDGAGDGTGDVEADGTADGDGSAEGDGKEGESGDAAADGDEPAGKDASLTDIATEAAKLGVSTRDASGRFKSKEQLAADVATAREAAGSKGGKPAGGEGKEKGKDGKPLVKEPDPVNDPIPKDLKVETQQRIRTLIDRTKEAEIKATEVQTNFDYLVNGVKATGATPEQYGETLSWLSLFNSQDPSSQRKALELIENVAERLATHLGVERAIADPLAGHSDLQTAVKAGQVTMQLAREHARMRNGQQYRTEIQTQTSQQHQQQQEIERVKSSAQQGLNQIEEQIRATDPLYEQTKAAILPMLKVTFSKTHPSTWVADFQQIYKEARALQQAPARPVVRKPAVPANQPLRAKSGGGAGGGTPSAKPEPKSGLDVLNAALAGMNKR